MGAKTKTLLSNLTRSRENDIAQQSNAPSTSTITPKDDSNKGDENNTGGNMPPVIITSEKPKDIVKIAKITIPAIIEQKDESKPGSGSIRISFEEKNFLDEVVRHKRMIGQTKFTIKEAVGEAISLLREKYPDVI